MPDAAPLHLDSLAVHAGRDDLRGLGVHAPPLDLSTTYPFESLGAAVASLDAMMTGGAPTAEGGAVYSRLHAPTVARFEAGLAALEGTEAAFAHQPRVEAAIHTGLINRGSLIAPFHNMMLVSPATRKRQIDRLIASFDAILTDLFPKAA